MRTAGPNRARCVESASLSGCPQEALSALIRRDTPVPLSGELDETLSVLHTRHMHVMGYEHLASNN